MNERRLALATRRGALLARSAAQREALATHARALRTVLDAGDTAWRGVDWLQRHPLAVGLAVMVLAVARPRHAWRWARRGFFVWRGWQGLRKYLSELRRP